MFRNYIITLLKPVVFIFCAFFSVAHLQIEYEKVMRAEDHTVAKKQLTDEQKNILKDAMQKKIDEAKTVKADEI